LNNRHGMTVEGEVERLSEVVMRIEQALGSEEIGRAVRVAILTAQCLRIRLPRERQARHQRMCNRTRIESDGEIGLIGDDAIVRISEVADRPTRRVRHASYAFERIGSGGSAPQSRAGCLQVGSQRILTWCKTYPALGSIGDAVAVVVFPPGEIPKHRIGAKIM